MRKTTRIITWVLLIIMGMLTFSGCGKKGPVTLSLVHMPGDYIDSQITLLVEEFNANEGAEQGITIEIKDEEELNGATPDLHLGYANGVSDLEQDKLADLTRVLDKKVLEACEEIYLQECNKDGKQLALPVGTSTDVIFVNGDIFEKFIKETGSDRTLLATWDGFFELAKTYSEWSNGASFCAIDNPIRVIGNSALAQDSSVVNTDGLFDYQNETFKKEAYRFFEALAKGYIMIPCEAASEEVMNGGPVMAIGESATVSCYEGNVDYLYNNTKGPMHLQILPLPNDEGTDKAVSKTIVGISVYESDKNKLNAAGVFVEWLVNEERYLEFANGMGLVSTMKNVENNNFDDEIQNTLFAILKDSLKEDSSRRLPAFDTIYTEWADMQDKIYEKQTDWVKRAASGESVEQLAEECANLLGW